jgi:hypothetical protein
MGKTKLLSLNVLCKGAVIVQRVERWWNDTGSGNSKCSEKHCHTVAFYTTNPVRTGLVSSPGYCSESPATSRLNHGRI